MAGKTKTSKSNESYFKSYNYEANKAKKLSQHAKRHPNDTQSQARPKAVFPKPEKKQENSRGRI